MDTAQLIRGEEISLPQPPMVSQTPLVKALRQRRTIRDMSSVSLPLPLLSELLWSAWGINRAQGPFGLPGRTAASASNSQEIDLYVALEIGGYRYCAGSHSLQPGVLEDLRAEAMTPGQVGVSSNAPLQLIYAVDLKRLTDTKGFKEPGLYDVEVQKSYYYVDTGLIAGNVYLFAAAYGLAAWFHNCNKEALGKRLGLLEGQKVLFAQSVGYAS